MGLDITLKYKIENKDIWVNIEDIDEINTEDCYFSITHNLGKIASIVGLYEPLWRPYKLKDSENEDIDIFAKDLIKAISDGLLKLEDKPELADIEPSNKWGTYIGLINFTKRYLKCLKNNPDAKVFVSR